MNCHLERMFGRHWGLACALFLIGCGEATRSSSGNMTANGSGGEQTALGGTSAATGGASASSVGAASAGGSSAALDPEPPPQWPGQHTGAGCPEVEPTEKQGCFDPGLECAFPVCWGASSRIWVCTESGFTKWFDGSSLCDPSRPCPTSLPAAATACERPALRCFYRLDCCGKDAGFTEASCRNSKWEVSAHPIHFACPECAPFPRMGDACSIETACKNGAPPMACYQPTCYGGTDVALCNGSTWEVTPGCSK